jgi:hypothetical protein
MIEAIKFWNEPNNLSHWDFQMDPEWRDFAEMTRLPPYGHCARNLPAYSVAFPPSIPTSSNCSIAAVY